MTTKSNTISMEQKMVLIKYMETHPDLSRGKLKAKSCHEDFMRMWKEVTHQLNSCRNGPKKNLVYWRQTWNDMKKTTKAKILQRRTAGADAPLVKLSPVQRRIAGLMCPIKSRCAVSTTNQETINTNYLEPQTCLDEGEHLNIPNRATNEISEPEGSLVPSASKIVSNNLYNMKSEPVVDGYSAINGTNWSSVAQIEENEVPESPESQLQDSSLVNSTCVNNFGPATRNNLITNGSRVSSSSPGLQYHSSVTVPNVTSANSYTAQENVQEGPHPQGDSDKFFEYQKQSAEALSQLAESHRKMAEAALRTATAEERKASALEQLVALLT